MLARNFLSAKELGLPPKHYDALIKTLHAMERGELKHVPVRVSMVVRSRARFSGLFSMRWWKHSTYCGTVACIGGTAELLGGVRFNQRSMRNAKPLWRLFYPVGDGWDATVEQAAEALSCYLTAGRAPDNW